MKRINKLPQGGTDKDEWEISDTEIINDERGQVTLTRTRSYNRADLEAVLATKKHEQEVLAARLAELQAEIAQLEAVLT